MPVTLINTDSYLEKRIQPVPGDPMYLHLSDLKLVMSSVADDRALNVLDFGCGGSPYQSLFPNAQYQRADLPGSEGIDYEIKPGDVLEPLPVAAGSFDLVLSSQVLEHVPEPGEYLREARRVLRPGAGCCSQLTGFSRIMAVPTTFSAGLMLACRD